MKDICILNEQIEWLTAIKIILEAPQELIDSISEDDKQVIINKLK